MTAEIIIIGAGASGLMAAIAAGRCLMAQSGHKNREGSILVFERMDKAGKKLLATGNGRCNFSNMYMEPGCFYSDSPKLVSQVLDTFGVEQTVEFFEKLGIYVKNKDGYLYPLSGQASSVLDVLLMEIRRLPVQIKTGCEISDIRSVKGGYEVADSSKTIYKARKVIVACGGCAYPKLGSNGMGYRLAKAAKMQIIEPVPALTGLYTRQKFFRDVSGVRVDAQISLYIKKKETRMLVAKNRGEVQLTDYGVSGIPAFQVSRHASKALADQKEVSLTLDFMPDRTVSELFVLLSQRAQSHRAWTTGEFLTGMFNSKLCGLFVNLSGLPKEQPVGKLGKREIHGLTQVIKCLFADIVKTGNFDNAQVCAGGVDCRELTKNLESKKKPGLYFTGELVDVDGICGGYNLQWAWSSGYIAGSHAAKAVWERT